MNEKPLGKITAILADLDLEVTYAYDDLVFIQHSAFLLQFTDQPAELDLFVNAECDPNESDQIVEDIVAAFLKEHFSIVPKGCYSLSQNDDDTIQLDFI